MQYVEKQEPKLTFTGMPLKDTSANAITITKQTAGTKDHPVAAPGQNLYNVVFEACTGKDVIRAPEVKITSVVDEKIFRLSDKIISNSCMMSAGKINAKDVNSITLEIANRSDISMKITELEKKIEMLISEQAKPQMELNKFVVQSEKPSDFEQKVTELSNKIIQLRNEIRDAKFQMYGNMYEVYKNP